MPAKAISGPQLHTTFFGKSLAKAGLYFVLQFVAIQIGDRHALAIGGQQEITRFMPHMPAA